MTLRLPLLLTACLLFLRVSAESAPTPLAESLKDQLVRLEDGGIVDAGADALEGKKLIAVYYSAHWCGPCRAFTPKLVDFYNQVQAEHPELEILFVSGDRSAEAMAEYMEWGKMTFPALKFDHRFNPLLKQHAARGIPYLIVLDENGKVLIEKPEGESWMSPAIALEKLKALLES